MNLKKRKFIILKEFYDSLNISKKNICLYTHVSNLNILESNEIKAYCSENKISTKHIKIGLLKKLTKNNFFNNLLNGPTRLFFFHDKLDFINFYNYITKKNKIYPLAIYFNDQFFNSLFFYTFLKTNYILNNNKLYNLFLYNMSNNNKILITKLNSVLYNFIINFVIYLKK